MHQDRKEGGDEAGRWMHSSIGEGERTAGRGQVSGARQSRPDRIKENGMRIHDLGHRTWLQLESSRVEAGENERCRVDERRGGARKQIT